MKKVVMLFFVILLISLSCVSAIRISPAKIEGNFKSNMEFNITFIVDSNLNRELELYVKGDLAEYVELSENSVFKQGEVIAAIRLPEKIEPPGPKRTYIGARELIDKEISGALGTSVAIESVVLIHVPYPGKYLESKLRAHNVNVNEPVLFELGVTSRGKEDVIMEPRIEIYSEHDELLETLDFKERLLESQERIELVKTLNTTDYGAGEYYGLSKIDYELKTTESRADFKIGELSINIINYTKQIVSGGIREFQLEIESEWNDKIDGAYAKIIILNNSKPMLEFRTSPTDLRPWEKATIKGYVDATNIPPGIYDAEATVIYYGRDKGETTTELIQIEFIEEEKINYLLIGGIVLGILILLVIIFKLRKNGRKKR